MAYIDAFRSDATLISKIGEGNAHLIWTLGMLLQESDLDSLASETLTDGSDDKKIDLLYLDRGEGRIILAQGYYSGRSVDSAPANKASDLNTAVAWLFSGEISTIPLQLRDGISECRAALSDGDINNISILYIHNLPESVNVTRELLTVQSHLKDFLGEPTPISITVKEFGSSQIEHLFASQESHIDVRDEIPCPVKILFSEKGPDWEAHIISAPGAWLHGLYNKYGDALFSANYRGFLGFNKRKKINIGIKNTAETEPDNFWVYNNGISVVTLGVKEVRDQIKLTGISIINGAQTTGSISGVDLSKSDLKNVKVLCRVIVSTDSSKISNIVKYNNTQNEIRTWDQYSADPEQVSIEGEFTALGYKYERKRGFQTRADSLSIEDVAQPLLSFIGNYAQANTGRNKIFERPQLYKTTYDGKKARHILFVYALAKAIDERRIELKNKSSAGSIIELEEKQLQLLRNLRFKNYLLTIIARCLEPILEFKVDKATIAFKPEEAVSSKHTLVELVALSLPVVTSILSLLCTQVQPDNLLDWMSSEERATALSKAIEALLYTTKASGQFPDWRNLISQS